MHLASLNSLHSLFRGKIIHCIAVFITDEGGILCHHTTGQFKKPFFFVLNPLNSIIGQKTEFSLTVFIFILVRQPGNFAFL